MIWQLMERLNDNPAAIILLPIAVICLGGAIPLMREYNRRRSIERALPEMLELISAELGAGLGLEQAFADVAKSRNDEAGKLLDLALERAQATSFSAALARFAIETRSSMVQRVVNLLDAALEQNAPLQDVTYRMSIEYEKLNTLLPTIDLPQEPLLAEAEMLEAQISALMESAGESQKSSPSSNAMLYG